MFSFLCIDNVNNSMYSIQSWKRKAIGVLIIATYCQALGQEIGEECTNKNGIVGFCQFKNKCINDTDLGATCNSEKSIVCCAKSILKSQQHLNSTNDQKEDQMVQSRFGFIPDFFHAPIPPQNPISSINFFNHQKPKIPHFLGNILHQSLNTATFFEDRPIQSLEQDSVTKFYGNNNNKNLNIDGIFESDQTTTRITRRPQNYHNYPNHETQRPNYETQRPNYATQRPNYETQRPNKNKNNYPNYQYTYNSSPNYVTQRPNQRQNNNINRPHQETYQSNQNNNFNRNPNYYTSTEKPQNNYSPGNYENNLQLLNGQTNSNVHEENKRPNQNNNYRPTSSSIIFPNDSTDDKSYTKFTTTTNNYYEYQNRPNENENAKRISEKKCEEYSKALTGTISALPLSINTASKPVPIEKCNSKSVGLIVGGTKAELGEFPHMVAIGFDTVSENQFNCGGTLISERYVLTAAHCAHSTLGNPVQVRLGELNLQNNNDGANPIDILVDKIIVHPNYVSTSKYNDIALIRLDKKVKFNNHIRPACLYNNEIIYSRKVTATGWGSIGYGDRSSDDLLKVDLDLIDNQKCNKLFENVSKTETLKRGIIDSMICAGDLMGGHDTCLGDSGGPLVIRSEKNACVFNLIGITSFGKFCATENSPGVYTKVSAFLPWIEQNVWS